MHEFLNSNLRIWAARTQGSTGCIEKHLRTMAAGGVPRHESEAPLEYLARMLDVIKVSAHSARRLTQLFERARFSPHEIDGRMKEDAIEALSGLRAELEVEVAH